MTDQAPLFLHMLFDGKPPRTAIQVWFKSTKKTHTFDDPEQAAASAASIGSKGDVYVASGLGPKVYERPQVTRALASKIVGIPGVWADIDVNGGPEGKTGAAPDYDTAIELAHSILEPTIIVNSGYGIQAWWLFEGGPWVFSGPDGMAEQERAAETVRAFQAGLRDSARQHGWNIDSTHDLARLMRVPGTYNCKGTDQPGFGPIPVELLVDDGPRHDSAAVTAAVHEFIGQAREAIDVQTGRSIAIELRGRDAAPPVVKLDELMSIDQDFAAVWTHDQKHRKSKNWSMNEYEMSIANYIARAGFTDQEMADTLVYHRIKWGDPKGKADRMGYIAGTIGKARVAIDKEEMEADLQAEREDAAEELATIQSTSAADPLRATSLFSKVIGGPEIRELIQDGQDPDTARFRLVLADGRDVPIGPARYLLSFDSFRERYMVVTGHLALDIKRVEWMKIVQALMNTATINKQDSRSDRAREMVLEYVDRGLTTDRDGACQAGDPWEDKYRIYVAAGPLTNWLRKIKSERIAEADVRQLLQAGGFSRKTVGFVAEDGRKSTRSYYFIDRDTLYEEVDFDDDDSESA